MKFLLLALFVIVTASCSAQSFFKPLPKCTVSYATGRFGLAADSTINVFRPVVGVTAAINDGTQLAGGVGAGFQHLKWDAPSQTWIPQYSISAIAFLGSNTSGTADVIAGGVVGLLNFVSLGYGYDFTQKKGVFLTGVQIHFN